MRSYVAAFCFIRKEKPIRHLLHVAVHVLTLFLAVGLGATRALAQGSGSGDATAPESPEAAAQDGATQAGFTDRWDISAELSLTDQSGNRSLRLWTVGLKFSHRLQEDFRLEGAATSRYGRSEGELVARSHYGSLAFDFRPRDTWSPFLFAHAEHDPFRRLDLRVAGGAGAKYTLMRRGERDEASLSLALLHSHESITRTADDPFPARRNLARWSGRARARGELRPGVTLSHTTFLQPLWDDLADYLLRSDTGLKVLVTERLAVSVEYALSRTSRPPQGVDADDRLLKTGFIVSF